MHILVIGGTGFLGSHLVPKLQTSGHEVSILTRSKEHLRRVEAQGASGIVGDIQELSSFADNIPAFDLIINIAMPPIKPGRISRRKFQLLRGQATLYIANALSLARTHECPLFLTLGTSFHSDTGRVFTENDPIQRFGIAKIGELADDLIEEALDTSSPPCIVFMPGQIYGPGGLFLTMYRWIENGRYRIVGKGGNRIPRIHVDDAAAAYALAVEKLPLREKFILADDTPCTVREFTEHMAARMGVPTPKSVPRFIIRRVLGRLLTETITMDCMVSNAKAKERLGWAPAYPSYREGLDATIPLLVNPRP
jgi:nucleoside-diphosphate-sugar epimerase